MRLPPYSGPFAVGCIDLEIPVRQPRSFATDILAPDVVNRPARTLRRRARTGDDTKAAGKSAGKGAGAAVNGATDGAGASASAAARKASLRQASIRRSRRQPRRARARTAEHSRQQREREAKAAQNGKGAHDGKGAHAGQGAGQGAGASAGAGAQDNGADSQFARSQPVSAAFHHGSSEKRNGAPHIHAHAHTPHHHHDRAPRTSNGSTANDDGAVVDEGVSHADGDEDGSHDDDDEYEDLSSWNPFGHGSKTSTLHLETCLFTLYYPSALMPGDERGGAAAQTSTSTSAAAGAASAPDSARSSSSAPSAGGSGSGADASAERAARGRYSHVAWVGRPKRASMGALASYVGQYGAATLPLTPAIFALMGASCAALVGPPLAEPDDPRVRLRSTHAGARAAKQHSRSGSDTCDEGTVREAKTSASAGTAKGKIQEQQERKGILGKIQAILKQDGAAGKHGTGTDGSGDGDGEADADADASIDRVWYANFDLSRFPVVVFSHGLAGSRLAYSQYCGELASHGVVVAALEHRDGSGIGTTVRARGGSRTQSAGAANGTAVGTAKGKRKRADSKEEGDGAAKSSSKGKDKGKQRADAEDAAQHNAQVVDEQTRQAEDKAHAQGTVTEQERLMQHAGLVGGADASETQDEPVQEGDGDSASARRWRQERSESRERVRQWKQRRRGSRYGTGFARGSFAPKAAGGVRLEPAKAAVPYLTFEKYHMRSFPASPTPEEEGLRQAQMAMRIAEIEECTHILHRLNDGEGYDLYLESTRGLGSKLADKRARKPPSDSIIVDTERQMLRFKGKLDLDRPFIVGHSFGGATTLMVQRTVKPPFAAAFLLDPWTEPLTVECDEQVTAPLYCINSESFTIWQESFRKLKQICHDVREANDGKHGWLMTLCGSSHLDFSDLPLILPHLFRSVVGPSATIALFFQATFTQMGLLRRRFRQQDEQRAREQKGGSTVVRHDFAQDKSAGADAGSNAGYQPNAAQASGAGDMAAPTLLSKLSIPKRPERIFSRSFITPAREYEGIGFACDAGDVSPTHCQHHGRLDELRGDVLVESPSAAPRKQNSLGGAAAELEKGRNKQASTDSQPAEVATTRSSGGASSGSADATSSTKSNEGKKAQRPHIGGVVANRTPSGNLVGQRRPTDETIDFIEGDQYLEMIIEQHRANGSGSSGGTGDDEGEDDAAEVLKHTQDLSDRLAYKKADKIRSLLALMLRSQGIKPGLAQPGKILCHQY